MSIIIRDVQWKYVNTKYKVPRFAVRRISPDQILFWYCGPCRETSWLFYVDQYFVLKLFPCICFVRRVSMKKSFKFILCHNVDNTQPIAIKFITYNTGIYCQKYACWSQKISGLVFSQWRHTSATSVQCTIVLLRGQTWCVKRWRVNQAVEDASLRSANKGTLWIKVINVNIIYKNEALIHKILCQSFEF
jgi:hypothetical protein